VRTLFLLVLAGTTSVACACGLAVGVPSAVSAGCVPSEATANLYQPVFNRPFAGAARVGNDFDHDLPTADAANGYVLTLCGVRDSSQTDGHDGYDFQMTSGTPLLAVAAGSVLYAGLEPPRACPQLGRTVQALLVEVVHLTASGDQFATVYGHLSRIDVATGDNVAGGTQVGLSGNTGCSGTPHLHFGVGRKVAGEYRFVDPYGWHGAAVDPWERDARGTISSWLWKPGEAPSCASTACGALPGRPGQTREWKSSA
jgi:murein DD-endopeptidase MepM/ murein hydrolase activator NlpD